MNDENLIKMAELSPSERRELAAIGGRASGAKRRRRKLIAESVNEALERQASSIPAIKKIVKANGLNDDADLQTVFVQTLILNIMTNKHASAKELSVLASILGEITAKDEAVMARLDKVLGEIDNAAK